MSFWQSFIIWNVQITKLRNFMWIIPLSLKWAPPSFNSYSASVSLNWRLLNQEKLSSLHYFLHHYSFFGTGIKIWNKNRHNYQKSNFDYDLIISKNRIFPILQFFSMLNSFTMMVYAHSVDFIISIFLCI